MSKIIDRFLDLAEAMQASAEGLSIDDVSAMFNCSRSSAERLKNDISVRFPYAYEEVDTGEKIKRWKLNKGVTKHLTTIHAEELSGLQNAIDLFKQQNMTEQAQLLENLSRKVQSLIAPKLSNGIDTDLEALLVSEGHAMRPGPKPKVSHDIIKQLREAILANIKVKITFRQKSSGNLFSQTVEPYAFLYGNNHYLVAYSSLPNAKDYRMFGLPNIQNVELTNEYFQRDEAFSLKDFTANSFGVFREDPIDVIWRFKPSAAKDAEEYLFHPTQIHEWNDDGSLTVKFRAGGKREMKWHLYTWGNAVKDLTDYEHIEKI